MALLADDVFDAGVHAVTWKGTTERGIELASGAYWATLDAGARRESLRIVLLR